YYGIGAACVTLAVLVAYGLYHSQHRALEGSIDGLLTQQAEHQQKLDEGKPITDAYHRIADWESSNASVVSLWQTLRKHLPGTDRIYLHELTVRPQVGDVLAKYTGNGRARTEEDVRVLL